ncbi:MAG: hypothetical protein MJE68_11085, partial [Proteobacteria bacterium]|nr:hypothetical protein [Pseudomonadota bacterium]
MSSGDRTPTFLSYNSTEMDGLNSVGKTEAEVTEPVHHVIPQNQYLYIKVKTDQGHPLTPALFAKDVILGMVTMQGNRGGQEQEGPLDVILLSDTEAVVEFSSRTNMDQVIA